MFWVKDEENKVFYKLYAVRHKLDSTRTVCTLSFPSVYIFLIRKIKTRLFIYTLTLKKRCTAVNQIWSSSCSTICIYELWDKKHLFIAFLVVLLTLIILQPNSSNQRSFLYQSPIEKSIPTPRRWMLWVGAEQLRPWLTLPSFIPCTQALCKVLLWGHSLIHAHQLHGTRCSHCTEVDQLLCFLKRWMCSFFNSPVELLTFLCTTLIDLTFTNLFRRSRNKILFSQEIVSLTYHNENAVVCCFTLLEVPRSKN